VPTCVGDWGSVTLNNYRNAGTGVDQTIRTGTAGNGATVTQYGPQPTSLPDGATIPAVATPVVARTGTGANWSTETRLVQCETLTTCSAQTPPFVTDHGAQTTPILTGFPVADAPPTNVGAWSIPQLATLGTIWKAAVVSGGNAARWCAAGAVVQVKRQDGEVVRNLKDHNVGTDDGRIMVQAQGDSTGAGTGASTCQGGTTPTIPCNQETYCSWDLPNKSTPGGGCAQATDCQTCTLRRLEYNSGAGYHCSADADCNLGATCTSGSGNCGDGSGTCSGSTADNVVTCGCNADCNLGVCASTATCEDSCPDAAGNPGTCPSRLARLQRVRLRRLRELQPGRLGDQHDAGAVHAKPLWPRRDVQADPRQLRQMHLRGRQRMPGDQRRRLHEDGGDWPVLRDHRGHLYDHRHLPRRGDVSRPLHRVGQRARELYRTQDWHECRRSVCRAGAHLHGRRRALGLLHGRGHPGCLLHRGRDAQQLHEPGLRLRPPRLHHRRHRRERHESLRRFVGVPPPVQRGHPL
jgi:hypothetical protein